MHLVMTLELVSIILFLSIVAKIFWKTFSSVRNEDICPRFYLDQGICIFSYFPNLFSSGRHCALVVLTCYKSWVSDSHLDL